MNDKTERIDCSVYNVGFKNYCKKLNFTGSRFPVLELKQMLVLIGKF